MSDEELCGFSLTPAGSKADWDAYLASMPSRGPDCPPEADLIETALEAADLEVRRRVEGHRQGCEYCASALAGYREKARPATSLLQSVSDELRDK